MDLFLVDSFIALSLTVAFVVGVWMAGGEKMPNNRQEGSKWPIQK